MTDDLLNRYLPAPLRDWVERRYYARVNEQARMEALIHDEAFWAAPAHHVGLFSDHGVVHVRDVARQILQVLEVAHGLLLPARPPERFVGFMQGYGVALAYLHDIGMADFSAFGRAMHPEFAAQAVFHPDMDELVGAIWAQGCGGMRDRLQALADAGALGVPPALALREILALSPAHSKSKVPIAVLNDRAALRATIQRSVGADLATLYREQRQRSERPVADTDCPPRGHVTSGSRAQPAAHGPGAPAPQPGPPHPELSTAVSRHYADFRRDSFGWLTADRPELRELADDVIDTLRALRAADALRQRGTVQKTSGGYEVFISQQTGHAVYALRLGGDRLYMLEVGDRMSAGEANIASTEIDRSGNLRVSFHRGAFADEAALEQAILATATIVQDVRDDVIESFRRAKAPPHGLKPAEQIETWLESTDDHPGFADRVRAELRRMRPSDSGVIDIVPSLTGVPELERDRYLAMTPIEEHGAWDLTRRQDLLDSMARAGYKTDGIDPTAAFRHVRLAHLVAGETLVEAGAPATMVYVPLDDGLTIIPLGGYAAFSVQAWMPLGNTGVIRGAVRNGTIVAERPVSALMIPKDVYLRHWHHTYSEDELRARLYRSEP